MTEMTPITCCSVHSAHRFPNISSSSCGRVRQQRGEGKREREGEFDRKRQQGEIEREADRVMESDGHVNNQRMRHID